MNFIVAWNELALSDVHTEKMRSLNLFQMRGFCGLGPRSCFSMCAIKMTIKATAHSYSVRLLDLSVQLGVRFALSGSGNSAVGHFYLDQ